MRLSIANHLQAVLDRTVRHIVIRQCFRQLRSYPFLLRQPRQPFAGSLHPQFRIASTRNQLARLGEKLDLTNATAPQLHIMTSQSDLSAQPFVLANSQTHVVCILDSCKIQMPAPNEGPQCFQEPITGLYVASRGARLDKGRALPSAPETFIIPLCRLHGDAYGRCRGIRAQT